MINKLIDIYNNCGDKEKLQPLDSADTELAYNINLTDKQSKWLERFIIVWEYYWNKECKE